MIFATGIIEVDQPELLGAKSKGGAHTICVAESFFFFFFAAFERPLCGLPFIRVMQCLFPFLLTEELGHQFVLPNVLGEVFIAVWSVNPEST